MNTRSISLAVMTLTIVAALTGCGGTDDSDMATLRSAAIRNATATAHASLTQSVTEPPTPTSTLIPVAIPTLQPAPVATPVIVAIATAQPAPTALPTPGPVRVQAAQVAPMPTSVNEPCPGAYRTNSACDRRQRAQVAAQVAQSNNGGNQP